jgi:hypothetical protein
MSRYCAAETMAEIMLGHFAGHAVEGGYARGSEAQYRVTVFQSLLTGRFVDKWLVRKGENEQYRT